MPVDGLASFGTAKIGFQTYNVWHTKVIWVESAWWVLMAWRPFGTRPSAWRPFGDRPSAPIMMTKVIRYSAVTWHWRHCSLWHVYWVLNVSTDACGNATLHCLSSICCFVVCLLSNPWVLYRQTRMLMREDMSHRPSGRMAVDSRTHFDLHF